MPARIAAALESGEDPGQPALAEQARIARDHVAAMIEHGGPVHGLRAARKHIGWYLASATGPSPYVEQRLKAWRRRLCTNDNPRGVLEGLTDFYAESAEIRGGMAA
jgi:tRNA-dihydrouridine synthase B